ncbi:MAG TPA: PQQ-binding-like beta-propeller repeat protein [Bryobacteraceae bacterium]|nr:PQQ-binding-like beta-propeller repeat protein [Bryobacteraceae bacterium]
MRSLRIVLAFASICGLTAAQDPHATWSDYGGAPDAAQYSSLKQIDRTNVTKLKVAWTYQTGDTGKYSFNPLVASGMLYVQAKNGSIVALDAATGKEIWVHPAGGGGTITTRGINYWESADHADRRLLFSQGLVLKAIDARTGKSIPSFGKNGGVDLREGLGRDPKTIMVLQSNTPGKVYRNLIILGSATNQEYDSAPGDIRAYNVLTGELTWSFHTIPHPGEFGYDTWPPDAWKTIGGANAWSELSLDDKRGIVYVPTASPKYNFYGGNRKGANLFGDSLLALDAATGKRLWHYQMVHHDIWDYDNATAPKLLTVQHDGKPLDIVAQAGKQGFLWVFDRVTGTPLWPIEEHAVPKSDLPGEEAWPTQPFPTKPPAFARQSFTEKDLSPYIDDPGERSKFRDAIQSASNKGLFTPPGLQPTIQMPGNNGGSNFGGAAAEPSTGFVYVVSKDFPALLKMEPDGSRAASQTGSQEENGQWVYGQNCIVCHGPDLAGKPDGGPALTGLRGRLTREQIREIVKTGRGRMPPYPDLRDSELNPLTAYLLNPGRAPSQTNVPNRFKSSFGFMVTSSGLSAIKPPWTTLTAYDLNQGTIRWQIPLGEVPELAAKGAVDTGSHFPKVNPVVTAGGLIFAAARDRKIRALDSSTGKQLWEFEAPAGLEGMPAIYEANGRQFVVFCAAAQATTHTHASPGHPAENGPIKGSYIAFALPETR